MHVHDTYLILFNLKIVYGCNYYSAFEHLFFLYRLIYFNQSLNDMHAHNMYLILFNLKVVYGYFILQIGPI